MSTSIPFDPGKPFYFTQQAPQVPKVKRGAWMLPLIATSITAIVMMFAFGQLPENQPASSTPTPSPTPEAKTEAAPPVTPTPMPSSSPATSQPQEALTHPDPIASTPPSSTPQYDSQPTNGLPWNANVRLNGDYRVLEVHSIPSSSSGVIGILEQGDAVKLLTPAIAGEGVMWVNVQKGGYSGWVQSEFLEVRQ